jgi:hypothetical protein
MKELNIGLKNILYRSYIEVYRSILFGGKKIKKKANLVKKTLKKFFDEKFVLNFFDEKFFLQNFQNFKFSSHIFQK